MSGRDGGVDGVGSGGKFGGGGGGGWSGGGGGGWSGGGHVGGFGGSEGGNGSKPEPTSEESPASSARAGIEECSKQKSVTIARTMTDCMVFTRAPPSLFRFFYLLSTGAGTRSCTVQYWY